MFALIDLLTMVEMLLLLNMIFFFLFLRSYVIQSMCLTSGTLHPISWYLTFDSMSESSRRQCTTASFFFQIDFFPSSSSSTLLTKVCHNYPFLSFLTRYKYNGSVDGEMWRTEWEEKHPLMDKNCKSGREEWKEEEKVKLGRMRIVSFWQLKCHFILHLHWLLSWPSSLFWSSQNDASLFLLFRWKNT